MATYDWLPIYAGVEQDMRMNPEGQSQDWLLQKLIGMAGPDFQKAKDAGIIDQGGKVDWTKAPKMGPQGNTPKNTSWVGVGGGDSRFMSANPWTHEQTKSLTGSYYNDPNYGNMALTQNRAPDSNVMKYGRMATMAMASMPMMAVLGPMLAGGMGVSPATGQILARLLMSSGSTLAQGGNLNFGQMAGSTLGGMTGVPGGSTLGGIAGSQLGR